MRESLCHYRLNLNRMVFSMSSHIFVFAPTVYLSWHHVKKKYKERVQEEREFVNRLISRRLSPRDWAKAMLESKFIELAVGARDPLRFATLGTILIEKEIAHSKNFRGLYHRCSSPHSEHVASLLIARLAVRQKANLPVAVLQ